MNVQKGSLIYNITGAPPVLVLPPPLMLDAAIPLAAQAEVTLDSWRCEGTLVFRGEA